MTELRTSTSTSTNKPTKLPELLASSLDESKKRFAASQSALWPSARASRADLLSCLDGGRGAQFHRFRLRMHLAELPTCLHGPSFNMPCHLHRGVSPRRLIESRIWVKRTIELLQQVLWCHRSPVRSSRAPGCLAIRCLVVPRPPNHPIRPRRIPWRLRKL